jgi:hypothetical protein
MKNGVNYCKVYTAENARIVSLVLTSALALKRNHQ